MGPEGDHGGLGHSRKVNRDEDDSANGDELEKEGNTFMDRACQCSAEVLP